MVHNACEAAVRAFDRSQTTQEQKDVCAKLKRETLAAWRAKIAALTKPPGQRRTSEDKQLALSLVMTVTRFVQSHVERRMDLQSKSSFVEEQVEQCGLSEWEAEQKWEARPT